MGLARYTKKSAGTQRVNVRLARANLVAKTSFDNALSNLDSTISANKTKNEPIENELKKLKTFDLSYFIGKGHFEEDGT